MTPISKISKSLNSIFQIWMIFTHPISSGWKFKLIICQLKGYLNIYHFILFSDILSGLKHAWNNIYTVDLVIFSCLILSWICDLRLFTKSRIRELSIWMIGSAHNNSFCEISKFSNLSSSRNSQKIKTSWILSDLQYMVTAAQGSTLTARGSTLVVRFWPLKSIPALQGSKYF